MSAHARQWHEEADVTARITRANGGPFPKWVGIVYFGQSYSDPDPTIDAYVWDTLLDVRHSVVSVARGRGVDARVAEWTDDGEGCARAGHHVDSLTPAADHPRIYVWSNIPDTLRVMEESGPPLAERVVYIGARGGVRVSNYTAEGLW